jgi:hypothetical protein
VSGRPGIQWPLYVTVWCAVGAIYAVRAGDVGVVICAALMVAAVWAAWATSGPSKGA